MASGPALSSAGALRLGRAGQSRSVTIMPAAVAAPVSHRGAVKVPGSNSALIPRHKLSDHKGFLRSANCLNVPQEEGQGHVKTGTRLPSPLPSPPNTYSGTSI